MTSPHATTEDLMFDIIGCIFANDMPRLLQCLSHPDGPQAALWENSGPLRTAIRKEHNHFLPVLLPYTCVEDGGFALSLCLAEGEIEAFDTLMAYNSNFARHLEDNALGWLGGHYQRALEDTSDKKKNLIHTYTQILERFFECMPPDVVEWQLGVMAKRAPESLSKTKSFETIERLWSERNKHIFTKAVDITTSVTSVTRKI